MTEYFYELKVPKDRVAVLIGKAGEIKKELETLTKTTLKIDSTEGDVTIKGEDALGLYSAREIIKAIARGFNPEIAKDLIKSDYVLEIINITDYAKTKNSEMRLKGRVIGSAGKSRRTIEELTGANISVYGKTVGIIGSPESVLNAKRAVESLLLGSRHASVYKSLEHKKNVGFDEPVITN